MRDGASVVVADHDPGWRVWFASECRRLLTVLPQTVTGIDHIGSTAVPGLAAKPIVDLLVGVRRLDDAPACIEVLEGLGYRYVPAYESAMPYRRFLRLGEGAAVRAHLHLVDATHPFRAEHLAFRDYLRADPAEARRYGELKRRLAGEHADDPEAYQAGKAALIGELNARALAWQAERVADAAAWSASPDRTG